MRTRTRADPVGEGTLGKRAHAFPLSVVWTVAAIAVPTAIATSTPMVSLDLAYQIRAGEIMLDLGRVLREDVLTVSALGRPWLNQQWGAQLVYGALFRTGGWLALALFRAAMTAVIVGLLYAACRNAGASRRWSAGVALAASLVTAAGYIQLRAQLFGILCFVTTQWLLSRRHRSPNSVWWALPVVVVWANTHGSFFLAPFLFAIAWAQDRRRGDRSATRLLLIGLATLPVTLVNPFGARVWSYVVSITTDPRIRASVEEWQPPTVRSLPGALFLLSVVAVTLYVGSRWSRVGWPTLAALGSLLVLGLLSIRGGFWWGLAAPVLLAAVSRREGDRLARPDPRGMLNAVLAAILCVISVVPLLRWLPYRGDEAPETLVLFAPMRITGELATVLEPAQPFFNPQEWGSWFELALPQNPVFVDSRWEVVPGDAWDDYDDVSAGREGWQAILDRRGFDVVVLAFDQQKPLLPLIRNDPGWTLAYEDAEGAIFTRSASG